MPSILALASSLLWGCSDFAGATLSRRRTPVEVIVWADLLILVVLIPLALGRGEFHLAWGLLGWGGGAGLVGMLGLLAFFDAMTHGPMGVVAPIAGLGVVVPVIVGVGLGERPQVAQYVGIGVGIVGVLLVSGGRREGSAGTRVLLGALGGALGFGACFVFIDRSERYGTLMTLIAMRVTTVVVIGAVSAVRRRSLPLAAGDLPLLAVIGVFDAAANGCFAEATIAGALAIVSVLSSLYPVVTSLLARIIHDERLGRMQLAGIGVTMAAVALLASGPGG